MLGARLKAAFGSVLVLHVCRTVVPSRFLAFAVTSELATGDRTMQQDVPLTHKITIKS